MSVNASVVINDVNTKKGREGIHASRIGKLSAGATLTFLESTSPVTVEFMEWATNAADNQIIISHRKIDGTYEALGILKSDGSNTSGITPSTIVEHSTSLFIINSHQEGKYKYTLRNPMHFANGLKIEIKNNNATTDINSAVRLFGVRY